MLSFCGITNWCCNANWIRAHMSKWCRRLPSPLLRSSWLQSVGEYTCPETLAMSGTLLSSSCFYPGFGRRHIWRKNPQDECSAIQHQYHHPPPQALADIQNEELAKAGLSVRVDHRSLKKQRENALATGNAGLARELDRAPGRKLDQQEFQSTQMCKRWGGT